MGGLLWLCQRSRAISGARGEIARLCDGDHRPHRVRWGTVFGVASFQVGTRRDRISSKTRLQRKFRSSRRTVFVSGGVRDIYIRLPLNPSHVPLFFIFWKGVPFKSLRCGAGLSSLPVTFATSVTVAVRQKVSVRPFDKDSQSEV